MEKKYKFIVNPIAGQGASGLAIPKLEGILKQNSVEYDLVKTAYPGHAIELANQAAIDDYKFVIAVGGDGTSNEVLNGLMKAWMQGFKNSNLGIIAIGRGNDFAYGFNIPAGLNAGLGILQKQRLKPIDVGIVYGGDYPQGRYFGNGVGIGFDAVVGFEAAKLTHLHGFLNYAVAALRTIFLYFRAPVVKIEYDEGSLTQPALMVSVMNGRRMGGGFLMAPNSLTDDGNLDFCIAGQVSRLGILKLITKFMNGTQATHRQIKTGRSTKVHVIAKEGSLPVHADGETICVAGSELFIKLIDKPIKILGG